VSRRAAETIDAYISRFPPEEAEALSRIRETVRSAAPEAIETISYGMPTFRLGKAILHFGAFKGHIGIYPPVREADLAARAAPYQGEKGNLRLPLDQPIPYTLIEDIVKSRITPGAAPDRPARRRPRRPR
jgi:uncharacterized protein YdhG (YjbR/CyaY superfamily)